MSTIIAIASGKGGVGKSVVCSNVAALLARRGFSVVAADLDIGAADLSLLYGVGQPKNTLDDFWQRKVADLSEVTEAVPGVPGLRLLAGGGDTLATANPTFATKQRLIRALSRLDCDYVVADIGAGSGANQIDFFLAADYGIVVSTTDPTAVTDAYKFVKLAALRKAYLALGNRLCFRKDLKSKNFRSTAELAEAAGKDEAYVRKILSGFVPYVVVNRAGAVTKLNTARLRSAIYQYLGVTVRVLGEIPEDSHVQRSVRQYLPVCECYPRSKAARSLDELAARIYEMTTHQDISAVCV